jgi:hypothetical protein
MPASIICFSYSIPPPYAQQAIVLFAPIHSMTLVSMMLCSLSKLLFFLVAFFFFFLAKPPIRFGIFFLLTCLRFAMILTPVRDLYVD